MSNADFASRLRRLRELKRLSRRVLSELCGLHHDAIRRFELRQAEPTIDSLIILADFFEVSVDYLIGRQNYR